MQYAIVCAILDILIIINFDLARLLQLERRRITLSNSLMVQSRTELSLRNDLYCVRWGVRLYYLTQLATVGSLEKNIFKERLKTGVERISLSSVGIFVLIRKVVSKPLS